jgi:hypothetical protein
VVSTLIDAQQITEIATENRNLTALATLGLGVSSGLPDSNTPTSVASSSLISVNGLRHAHNIWLIDGGEADDRGGAGGSDIMPSQDAIAQFEMLSSNYPPDYGISSGATISMAIKSGTRNFHGRCGSSTAIPIMTPTITSTSIRSRRRARSFRGRSSTTTSTGSTLADR